MLTPQFELNGGGTYVDVTDDDTALYVGGVYNFTDMFALSGDVSVGDNATAYGVGMRHVLLTQIVPPAGNGHGVCRTVPATSSRIA